MGIGYSVLTTNLNFQIRANKKAPETLIEYLREKAASSNSDGLKLDDWKNVRYVGRNVNNFVRFNDNYWRIIGVVDEKVKLIRYDAFGGVRWDDSKTNYYGSSILKFLTDYYQTFTDSAKNMVSETDYYVFGSSSSYDTRKQAYENERSQYRETWYDTIGLMYPSDYAYASECNHSLGSLNESECTSTNWLFEFEDSGEWLISSVGWSVWYINYDGAVAGDNDGSPSDYRYARPVVHLDPAVILAGGSGTHTDPYLISLP